MPKPEKSYLRVIYLGRLKLQKHPETQAMPTLDEMMLQIWNWASAFNKANFISGHLAFTTSLHVAQLLEGEENVVSSLMSRIREDPRVVIEKELSKKLSTVNLGWEMSMFYSFKITALERRLVTNKGISMREMFDTIENTYHVRKEKLDVTNFYKRIIDCILLKYFYRSLGKPEIQKLSSTKCTMCNFV